MKQNCIKHSIKWKSIPPYSGFQEVDFQSFWIWYYFCISVSYFHAYLLSQVELAKAFVHYIQYPDNKYLSYQLEQDNQWIGNQVKI